MNLKIKLDPKSKTAKHRQISERIRTLIVEGSLPPGGALPPIRTLATRLNVSPLTVFQAYESLKTSGLTESTVGSGTRVSERISATDAAALLYRCIETGPSNIFETVSAQAGIRSLASAVPDPTLFRSDDFFADLAEIRHDPWKLYYPPDTGYAPLRREIAKLIQSYGANAAEGDVLINEGSTQALYLVITALTSAGDKVLVMEPCGIGLAAQIESLGRRLVGWNCETSEPDFNALKRAISRHDPQLIIVSPTFGATTGNLWSENVRKEFAAIARRSRAVVVEDGTYADIGFVKHHSKPFVGRGTRSIYVGSFSYSLVSGMNVGYVVSTGPVQDKLSTHLRLMRQSGNPLIQIALARFLAHEGLQRHLISVIPKYQARRDAMLHALRTLMPRGTHWTTPTGGFSCWVTVPFAYENFVRDALKLGVAITPGQHLSSSKQSCRSFRLSYSLQTPEGISEAMKVIGRLLAKHR